MNIMCQVDIGVITFHEVAGKPGDPYPVSGDTRVELVLNNAYGTSCRISVPNMSVETLMQ